ncbi:hypothetical protein SNOG_04265 [Parastagonospora nodorum SN15]|uniref:Uncharacterized protein n=1 Tax=Phaeosphaeria nodorum (strain SN15 / ATCC MYA-4574 / FGSC 10173) TaxID=321614 RepID=Q0UVE9_PHANO|nr:hypothetical protein SNOG_04265 [Parastagonospora nodorum SN15]EAT88025.1 hypothetical protein SNOG_04265 [Parastagonospora nodorum SN15]
MTQQMYVAIHGWLSKSEQGPVQICEGSHEREHHHDTALAHDHLDQLVAVQKATLTKEMYSGATVYRFHFVEGKWKTHNFEYAISGKDNVFQPNPLLVQQLFELHVDFRKDSARKYTSLMSFR